jgi:hypothetical protein
MNRKSENYKNILRVLDAADPIDVNEGRIAYFRYNELLKRFADRYSLPFPIVCAAFAALSPNNDYLGNLRSLKTVIEGFQSGRDRSRITVSTYGHCRDRALKYLDGSADFLGTVKGKKIKNFYQNILNPIDPVPVTIDGHAVNLWLGKIQSVKDARGFHYETVANDFRRAAIAENLIPNQVQAITWFAWKRINRILFKPQLKLFGDPSDRWETIVDLDEIKTFQ